MTSLKPRSPYTVDEVQKYYPKSLELSHVQVLLRHGERSPVSARFQNAGLAPYWPYCNAARTLTSTIMTTKDSEWGTLQWRRRLEVMGTNDMPVIASGPEQGQYDGVCQPGELTDEGRQSTLALGQRLRNLYVDQLNFMPATIASADLIYLRATPIPRALESVQQCFWGFYPPSARSPTMPIPTIVTRSAQDETLFPNDSNCRRFNQLSRAFADRAAEHWNSTPEMDYLQSKIGKWMPETSPRVAVDSHPRLSGIMDTINATLAHGDLTKMPKEFYDDRARQIIDRIAVEEWFQGYRESAEYRAVGIGGLMGDIVTRMVGHVEANGDDGIKAVGGETGQSGKRRAGETATRFALSGCHDTTLAALGHSLGAFKADHPWPPYTSSIAFELFKTAGAPAPGASSVKNAAATNWLFSFFSRAPLEVSAASRTPLEQMSTSEKHKLNGYYVRMRYNDAIMTIPGCKPAGKHFEGDETFCTLEAFKAVADKFTPKSWKTACMSNLDQGAFAEVEEPGY